MPYNHAFFIPDRMIKEFLRQCPYCQITNRLRIPIKAHRFTCASYNPFEVLHLDQYQKSDQYQGNVQLTIIADTQQLMRGTLWIAARHW